MKLVDADGNTLHLDNAWLVRGATTYKIALHDYLFSDDTDATWLGRGPTQLRIQRTCTTTELEAMSLFLARGEELALWFPSAQGDEDNRYYQRVIATSGPQGPSATAGIHRVEVPLLALDPCVYDVNGQVVG